MNVFFLVFLQKNQTMKRTRITIDATFKGLGLYMLVGLALAALMDLLNTKGHEQVTLAMAYFVFPPVFGAFGLLLGLLLALIPKSPSTQNIQIILWRSALGIFVLLALLWVIRTALIE